MSNRTLLLVAILVIVAAVFGWRIIGGGDQPPAVEPAAEQPAAEAPAEQPAEQPAEAAPAEGAAPAGN